MKRVLPVVLLLGAAAACDSPSGSSANRVAEVIVSAPATSVNVGGTVQLSAQARASNGQVVSGASIAWSSLAPAVAGVDGTGLVTGLAAGTARIVAASGGFADTLTVTVVAPAAACTPASALSLAVGEVRQLEGAAAASLCLAGGAAGAEFTIVPFFSSTNQEANVQLQFQGTGIAAPAGPPNPSVSTALWPASLRQERHPRDGGFHVRLRERSRPVLQPLVPGARAAYRARRSGGARFDVSAGAVPAVGSLLTLNANSDEACTNPNNRVARVEAVSTRAIIAADTTNPSGGLSAAEYQHVATTFDTLIWPVLTNNFGEPADVDENQRIVIFYTRAVNDLTPANVPYIVGGFFWSRDLFPKTAQPGFGACAASNYAEMFYMLAADPFGEVNGNVRSRAYVVSQTLGTVGHEMQHLISASRRLYEVGTVNYDEEIWLNEGLSHVAEELLFYRATGLQPRQNLTLPQLQAPTSRWNTFLSYGYQNLARFSDYLEAPSSNSPFAPNDDLATRGSAWAFLRYAADRRAGDDTQLWYDLVNNERLGLANLQHHLGADPRAWARDFNVALYTDDAGVGAAPQFRVPSWNFRSVYPGIPGFSSYPLATRTLTGTQNVSLQASGASYLRTAVGAGGLGAVQVTSGGAIPPASVSVSVVRTK
jgi:hypothetical protein